jgi:competence protein ComEC
MQVYAIGGQPLHYGDMVELEGALVAPDSTVKDYLARQKIFSVMNYPHLTFIRHDAGDPLLTLLFNLRQQARDTINAILPAPESGLLVGILQGIPDDLPAAEVAAFQATGTAHIWALSGFNIAIVSGLLVMMLGRLLPRRRLLASLLAIGAVTLYTLRVGANPSVVRAAIMGTVGMFGPLLGRRQVGANSLTFTAAVMCVFDPTCPITSVSSFHSWLPAAW